MKKILILRIPILFLLLFLYGGCSNGGGSNNLICDMQEMQDRFANTDCIAEELVTGCSNISCRFRNGTDIDGGNFDEGCTVIDCETLECEDIVITNEGPPIVLPGFLTELVINEANGLPSGLFVVDETVSPFDCIFIANN